MTELQPSAQQIWEQTLRALGKKAARPGFESSIKQVTAKALTDNSLDLVVASAFARDWLEKRGTKAIETALAEVVGHPLTVRFGLAQMDLALEPAPRKRTPRQPARSRAPEEPPSTPLNPKYTFDNFVVGSANRFAEAAARAVAKAVATGEGKGYNPLFLYGGVGLGKTHLMQAIGHYLHAHTADPLRVEYISGDTFTFDVVTSIREDRFTGFRKKYRSVDVWLVDDIQFIAAKERTEAEFFQVFNTLYETGKQVVITSDRPPKELQVMDARLRSRFESGLIADIKPPDLETRLAILQHKASSEQVEIPEEVLRYVARVVKSNIRALEGALISVLAAASLMEVPISLNLAAEQLKSYSAEGPQQPLSIATVQQVVSQHFSLTIPELIARNRARKLVFPRQVAMYLCREMLNSSFPSIARAFGGKDHSTVIHACSRVREQMKEQGVEALVNELASRLRSGA